MKSEPDSSSPVPETDLLDLVARVRSGDEDAARVLVERLYSQVRKIVVAHLARRDDPEDIMQEVYLKAFGKLAQFRGQVPFAHWVARIALTTCLDRLRRQRTRPELRWSDLAEDERALVESAADPTGCDTADAGIALSLIERLLAALPAGDAWLLRQVELEEKSLTEVCEATGWNAGLVRVRLFRARRRLQAAYQRLERRTT